MYHKEVPIGQQEAILTVFEPDEAPRYGLTDWSLAPLQTQGDVQERYAHAKGISAALRSVGIREAFAPHVAAASAVIIDPAELVRRIRLGSVSLYRNPDKPADGVPLNPGEAFVASAAGCPIIMASADAYMVVAHAGRDSLIDRGEVTSGKPSRPHSSVVDAIVAEFKKRGITPYEIAMCMHFAIPAESFEHRFSHPRYGEFNRELEKFINRRWPKCTVSGDNSMFLNLEFVFEEQAKQAGVWMVGAMNSLAEFPEFAHTRDGKDPGRRNLIIVKRAN